MNFPLSEIVSWVLEPLASAMENSGELVSGEDLKSKIDNLNKANNSWVQVPDSTANVMDMEGAKASEHIPKLCEVEPDDQHLVEEAGGATQNNGQTCGGGVKCSASSCEGGVVCPASSSKLF